MTQKQQILLLDRLIELMESGALMRAQGAPSVTADEQRVMTLLRRNLAVLRDLEEYVEPGEVTGDRFVRSTWWDLIVHCRSTGAPSVATLVASAVLTEEGDPEYVNYKHGLHDEALSFLRVFRARLSGWWDRKGQILDLYRRHGPMNVSEIGDKLARLGDERERTQVSRLCRQLAELGRLEPMDPVAAEGYRRRITDAGLADLANRGV